MTSFWTFFWIFFFSNFFITFSNLKPILACKETKERFSQYLSLYKDDLEELPTIPSNCVIIKCLLDPVLVSFLDNLDGPVVISKSKILIYFFDLSESPIWKKDFLKKFEVPFIFSDFLKVPFQKKLFQKVHVPGWFFFSDFLKVPFQRAPFQKVRSPF